MKRSYRPLLLAMLACMTASIAHAEDASKAGAVFKEHPTLHCLGVRWPVTGDANKNAVAQTAYRKAGETEWKQGLPLFRCVPNPKQGAVSTKLAVSGGWMFAGSLFGLTPDTEYEVKLNLKDPDGGDAEQIVKMKTWKEPTQPEGMTEIHVAPGAGGGTGTKTDPFKGFAAAKGATKPGTVVWVHPGTYPPFNCPVSGTEQKPVIYRGVEGGEAIIAGAEPHKGTTVGFANMKHIWFENLTIKNAAYGLNGNGSSHMVVRGCKFRDATKGFNAEGGGYNKSVHHFIVDNDFIGPTKWPRTKGIESYCFIQATGGGHVIAYNRMQNVGDGVHGKSRGSWSACDVYANDLNICTDDGLETDHCDFNIRVWGNRIRNCAHGITAQPSHAGPVYIIKNFIYSATYSPFKLHNHTTGVLLLHNTCFKKKNAFNIVPASETVVNIFSRNNLFITAGGTGLFVGTPNVKNSDFDSDGFGGHSKLAVWNSKNSYATPEDAKKGGQIYSKVGAHLIKVDSCFASGLKAPTDEGTEYKAEDLDYRLAANSDALDKGVVLPNINDGFKGKAPDLGALELGEALPHFGPRPKK